MPFKSEKQRRYLWANEPEIARDWTDTYGSRVQKNNGGIMHNFANYAHDDGSNVSVPRSFQARPHSDQVNLAYITPEEQGILQALKPGTPHRGPMEIPNYDSFDVQGGYATSGQLDAPTRGDIKAGVGSGGAGAGGASTHIGPLSSGAQQAWDNMADQRKDYQDVENIMWDNRKTAFNLRPEFQKQTQMYNPRSKWGIGNLFRGAMSMFRGWPGSIMSMLSRIDPRQLRGKNPDGSWRTQREWEDARNLRRDEKRMAYLADRRARGLDFGDQAYADLLAQGIEDPFQSAIDADYEREGDDLYLQNPSKNYLSTIDLSKYDKAPPYDDSNFPGIENRDMQKYLEDETNFNNQGIRSIDTIAKPSPWWKWLPKM